MSKENIRIKGLSGVRLRSDGTEVHLTFQTSHNKELTIVVPGSEMQNLTYQMMAFDHQAQIKREIPPDPNRPKVTIDTPPPIFFTHGMQGVVRPDAGALDLQLQDVSGREIQVCFTPEQMKYLFGLMLESQNFDDQKPN